MENLDDEFEFDKLMQVWRKTVCGFSGSGGAAMPGWAALYIKGRDAFALNKAEAVAERSYAQIVAANQALGWLVEATVREMPDYDEKMVLRYVYIFSRPDDWIRCHLYLRRVPVSVLLERARNNLRTGLANKIPGTRIASNNLRAAVASP